MENCAEMMGRLVLIYFCGLSMMFWFLGLILFLAGGVGPDFVSDWINAKLMSWLYWFGYSIPIFILLFPSSKKKFHKAYGKDDKPAPFACMPDTDVEARIFDKRRFPGTEMEGDAEEPAPAPAPAPAPPMMAMGGVQVHPMPEQARPAQVMQQAQPAQVMQQAQPVQVMQHAQPAQAMHQAQPAQIMQHAQPAQLMQQGVQMVQQHAPQVMQQGMQVRAKRAQQSGTRINIFAWARPTKA
jgi:hypothetical protein